MIAANGMINTFDSQDRFLFMPGDPNAMSQIGPQNVGGDLQLLGQDFQKLGSDLDAGQQDGGTSGGGDMMPKILALLQGIEQTLENQSQAQDPGGNGPELGGVPSMGDGQGVANQATSTGGVPPQGAPANNGQDPSSTPAQAPTESGPGNGKTPRELSSLEPSIDAASKSTGVPKDLLSAVIWDESRGKKDATSTNPGNGKTDGGLMQINPDTFGALQAKHPELSGKSLSDPGTNIMAGAYLLADEKAKFGSWDLALRAYNSGEGSVDPGNANVTTTGLGDPDYVRKVNQNETDIDGGAALPS